MEKFERLVSNLAEMKVAGQQGAVTLASQSKCSLGRDCTRHGDGRWLEAEADAGDVVPFS